MTNLVGSDFEAQGTPVKRRIVPEPGDAEMPPTNAELASLDLITHALSGLRGEDQQRIAEVGIGIVKTLLQKNADYGSSAFKAPLLRPDLDPTTAIEVRMSDKIERLINLLQSGTMEVDEPVLDTFSDLAGYSILRVVCAEMEVQS